MFRIYYHVSIRDAVFQICQHPVDAVHTTGSQDSVFVNPMQNVYLRQINNSNLLHEAADYLFYYCACFAKLVVLR